MSASSHAPVPAFAACPTAPGTLLHAKRAAGVPTRAGLSAPDAAVAEASPAAVALPSPWVSSWNGAGDQQGPVGAPGLAGSFVVVINPGLAAPVDGDEIGSSPVGPSELEPSGAQGTDTLPAQVVTAVSPVVAASAPLGHGGPPLPAPSIAEQISRDILVRADLVTRPGQTDFHLHLEPPELGSVHVHLSMVEQTVSARVTLSGDMTRPLAEQQMQALRDALANLGVTLRSFDVAGSGAGWQGPGSDTQSNFQPPRPYDEPRLSNSRPAGPRLPAAVAGPGRIDLVA